MPPHCHPSRPRSTAHGAAWRTPSRSSNSTFLRPDLRHLLRRQPTPAPLLRLRVDPLRCPQASTSRHPAGPCHRGNSPAQAPHDRRPRHRLAGSRSPWTPHIPRPLPSLRFTLDYRARAPTAPHRPPNTTSPGTTAPSTRSEALRHVDLFVRCFEKPARSCSTSLRLAWPPPGHTLNPSTQASGWPV